MFCETCPVVFNICDEPLAPASPLLSSCNIRELDDRRETIHVRVPLSPLFFWDVWLPEAFALLSEASGLVAELFSFVSLPGVSSLTSLMIWAWGFG